MNPPHPANQVNACGQKILPRQRDIGSHQHLWELSSVTSRVDQGDLGGHPQYLLHRLLTSLPLSFLMILGSTCYTTTNVDIVTNIYIASIISPSPTFSCLFYCLCYPSTILYHIRTCNTLLQPHFFVTHPLQVIISILSHIIITPLHISSIPLPISLQTELTWAKPYSLVKSKLLSTLGNVSVLSSGQLFHTIFSLLNLQYSSPRSHSADYLTSNFF